MWPRASSAWAKRPTRTASIQAAATAYAAALEKAGKSDLGEKSAHKLGWAYYRLDSAAEAQQAFSYQRATWPKGPLAADAAFMEAECLFKQKKYGEALTAYERVKDTSSKDFQVLTLLHSAQALDTLALAMLRPDQENQRKETWQKGLALARPPGQGESRHGLPARGLVRARLGLAESRPL